MPFDVSRYQAVLLDLDGTLCEEDHPLPGAVELVRDLNAGGKQIACLSNSTQSPRLIAQRLSGMGINLPAEKIFTAAHAAVEYCLNRYGPRPNVFNLATEGVEEMLAGNATSVQTIDEHCDAVLVGNPTCVYATVPRMRTALGLIRRGAACLGLCADRLFPSKLGIEVGSGAMTWMLAYAADVKPIFFGKPQKEFFLDLCRTLGVAPQSCVLVGDNLDSDIAGAKAVQMTAILSLTGVTRESDLKGLSSQKQPDAVVMNLGDLALR